MSDKDPFNNDPITFAQLREVMIAEALQDKMKSTLPNGVGDHFSHRIHDLTLEPIRLGQETLKAYSENIGLGASIKF